MSRVPRLLFRWLFRLLILLFLLLVLGFFAGWWAMRGSLATLDGPLRLPGLTAPASIERDALGVVTIRAANETDAARALGYVHGQERFFEMDLLRRSAAGELSELFGALAVDKDKQIRVHRLRAMVQNNIDAVAGDRLPVLKAYAEGVNAGLHDLKARPWPYLLLRVQPKDWQVEDSALAGYAMFFDLQDESNSRELALWKIKEVVPDALYRLIGADGTEWDAPLIGPAHGNVPLPDAATLDLRKLPMPSTDIEHADSEPAAPGSNNFAVDGTLTADGRAIVANDMHLTLRVPDIWFRARIQFADPNAPDGKVDVAGFTLPGVPFIVAGSNRHVAWGFTNSYGDWLDFYQVQWLDAAHTRYQTPAGVATAQRFEEKIHVKGGDDVSLPVDETIWGPVTETLDAGHSLALDWTAHHPGSLTLGLAALESVGDLDAALAIAPGIGMPAQNLVIGDSHGRIAWRLTGRIPQREPDCLATAPATADHDCAWRGWRDGADNPHLVDPPLHRLWTANARTTDGEQLAMIGDSGYANGARAKQIRDDLLQKDRFSERDLLAIQLDNRAIFLERWWKLLRPLASSSKGDDWRQIEAATRNWEGRADTDAVTYRIVRAWRLAVIDRIKDGLMAPAMARLGKDFVMPDLPQIEGVAWELASQRPAHLLPRKFASWDALFDDAAKDVVADVGAHGPLSQRSWGERNTAQICHPLAAALPKFAGKFLCMPAEPLAGDANMPRVIGPKFGASERMVVAPGHEENGIVEMPGGQSGNPLSPFWGAGHEAWVRGEPTPFLPGKTTHTLTLKP